MTVQGSVRFGNTNINYTVRRSARRRKTVQVSVVGGDVVVAAPMRTSGSGTGGHRPQARALDPPPCRRI